MAVTIDGKTYYRTQEACKKTGISRATIFRWIKNGIIKDVECKDRRGWRLFSEEDISNISKVNMTNIKLRQAEDKLEWEIKFNKAVAELATSLIQSAPLDEISYMVLNHAKYLTDSKIGFVGYIDPKSGHLVAPTLTRDVWDKCNVHDKDIIFEEFSGLWGWVLKNRKTLMTNNPEKDSRSSGTPDGHVKIERFLSAPAVVDERLIGLVSLANAESDYEKRDVEAIEHLASLYAIAIDRKQREDELRDTENELRAVIRDYTNEI